MLEKCKLRNEGCHLISPLSSSQSGLLHGLHALHGEIQISQQR